MSQFKRGKLDLPVIDQFTTIRNVVLLGESYSFVCAASCSNPSLLSSNSEELNM